MMRGPDYGVGMGGSGLGKTARERPADVRTAYELWCGVAGLGVLGSIALVFVMLGDRAAYLVEINRQIEQMQPANGAQTLDPDLLLNIGVAIAGVLGVVIAGLVLLLAHLMRGGRGWARVVLTGAMAAVVVSAIGSFTATTAPGAAPLVLEIITIVQAVLAVGATVLVHRRDANAYFAKPRPR